MKAPDLPVYDDDENEVWAWTVTGLDKYYGGGQEVRFSTIYTGAGTDYAQADPTALDTVYSYTPETFTVYGAKTWMDDDNADSYRPESVTIRLRADGEVIDTQTVTAAEDRTWNLGDLPKYSDGLEITYTVTEDAADDHSTSYDGYDVINSYTPGKTSVTVEKVWDDDNDRDGIRPDCVTVRLLADGEETGRSLVLSDENGWEDSFRDLDEYEGGVPIRYTVEDADADDYAAAISGDAGTGCVITNTYIPETPETPETVTVSGSKTWDDSDDQDGMRPDSITIRLSADGTETDSKTVTAEDGWSWSFEDLPGYADGKEITYTISEDAVEDHGTAYDGYDVINTHEAELLNGDGNLRLQLDWDDNDDAGHLRPGSVTVSLLADGEVIYTTVLTESDNWTFIFTGLARYHDGTEINYTMIVSDVDGYSYTVEFRTDEDGSIYAEITDSLLRDGGTTEITVTKVWDDGEDADNIRPFTVTVELLADGEETGLAVVLSEENAWENSFTGLEA